MGRAAVFATIGGLLLVQAAAAAPRDPARQSCQARWAELSGTNAATGWTQSRFISNCLRQRHPAGHAQAGAPTGPILAATAAAAGVATAVAVAATHQSEKPASP